MPDATVRAYYNEFDRHAAAWLRELIADGLIAPGDVDERSIVDVKPEDLRGYTQCHFFAGIGGWSYALRLAGWPDNRPVWTASLPCQPFSCAGRQKGLQDERHLWPVFASLVAALKPELIFGEQVEAAVRLGWLDGVFDSLEGLGYTCGAASLPACSVGAPHIRQRLYWVANAESGEWSQPHTGDGRQMLAAGGADNGGLANATYGDGRGRECGAQAGVGPGRERRRGLTGGGAADGGLPHAEQPRLEGHAGDERDGREPGRNGAHQAGPTPASGGADWHSALWLPCRDGKARPTQPGVAPLVDGLPGRVGRGGDSGAPEVTPDAALNTSEARVMRLRGYGNAIVPQLAAEFIAAAMEVIDAA